MLRMVKISFLKKLQRASVIEPSENSIIKETKFLFEIYRVVPTHLVRLTNMHKIQNIILIALTNSLMPTKSFNLFINGLPIGLSPKLEFSSRIEDIISSYY